MKTTSRFFIGLSLFITLFATSCKDKNEPEETPPPTGGTGGIDASTSVSGYNILSRLPGIWNGPVTSSTPLGSYPEWIVDFRPVAHGPPGVILGSLGRPAKERLSGSSVADRSGVGRDEWTRVRSGKTEDDVSPVCPL